MLSRNFLSAALGPIPHNHGQSIPRQRFYGFWIRHRRTTAPWNPNNDRLAVLSFHTAGPCSPCSRLQAHVSRIHDLRRPVWRQYSSAAIALMRISRFACFLPPLYFLGLVYLKTTE